MTDTSKVGYDAPPIGQAQDDLDRWRFASELMNVISGTPDGWSIRIGVFGKWGEGKTTVLRFVERFASKDGHLVVWFNPWASNSSNELWTEFALQLFNSMETAGIKMEGGRKLKLKLFGQKAQKFLQPAERLSEANIFAKAAVGATFSFLRQLLNVNGTHIKQVRQKLGDKRVVVLIDDLDRTDPKLIPQFLLSLREFLDLPGFAFVLGFDEEIVRSALTGYHPGWRESSDFLEKILDFRLPLPPVTDQHRIRLFRREMLSACPFVDPKVFPEVEDLLPKNPRRLKALVRNLAALKAEVQRHDSDELNWIEIIIAQLIKLESSSFLEKFLEGDSVETEIGVRYQVRQY
ncbi:MAG: P-loop NTPase fold protein, partial [Bryobacteraceae bacterium]